MQKRLLLIALLIVTVQRATALYTVGSIRSPGSRMPKFSGWRNRDSLIHFSFRPAPLHEDDLSGRSTERDETELEPEPDACAKLGCQTETRFAVEIVLITA